MLDLTIAVASVPSRLRTSAADLLDELVRQAADEHVEVVSLFDNKRRTIGAKRNALLALAQGRYVAFVDDDDRVSDHYVDSLLRAIRSNDSADCVVFDAMVYGYAPEPKRCRYGVEFAHYEAADSFYRKPNQWMCYRTAVARLHPFLDVNCGEDDEWASRACRDIRCQVRIDEVLYTYQFDAARTETQGLASR